MNNPLVSFIIAAYNEEQYIIECVESCLNQTYGNTEVVVTDDGSTDNTLTLLLSHYSHSDRVKILSFATNKGKVAAFNNSFKHAAGEYIALIGADDINQSDRIELQAEYINKYEFVASNYDIVNDDNTEVIIPNALSRFLSFYADRELCFKELIEKTCTIGNTIFFTRNLGELIFPLPESLAYEDRWLGVMASYYTKVCFINKSLVRYRMHGNNTSYADINSVIDIEKWFKRLTRDYSYYEELQRFINDKNLMEYSRKVTGHLSMLRELLENDILKDLVISLQTQNQTHKRYYQLLNVWLEKKGQGKTIGKYLQKTAVKTVAIYGMGELGKRIMDELSGFSVKYIIDRNSEVLSNTALKIPVIQLDDIANQERVDLIIVTPVNSFVTIKRSIEQKVDNLPIISLEDIIFSI